ncbi:MAG: hypothetical protein H6564_15540 [Lewinellaceae bacterium]|nr:hypothetical protein [Lewinellaceae bacterium]
MEKKKHNMEQYKKAGYPAGKAWLPGAGCLALLGAALFLLSSAWSPLPAQAVGGSCADARWVGPQSSYHIGGQELTAGAAPPAASCRPEGLPSTHAYWFRWEVERPGLLYFTLLPDESEHDLDFVLYRLPQGVETCGAMEPVRCMAAGPRFGAARAASLPCLGATGLRSGATGEAEPPGCPPGNDNFLQPLGVQAGEAFMLWVNNYSGPGGFTLAFDGGVALAPPGHTRPSWALAAFPNPGGGDFQLAFHMPAAGAVALYALSANGRQLYRQEYELPAGPQQLRIPAAAWPQGLYWLGLEMGGEREFVKVEKM